MDLIWEEVTGPAGPTPRHDQRGPCFAAALAEASATSLVVGSVVDDTLQISDVGFVGNPVDEATRQEAVGEASAALRVLVRTVGPQPLALLADDLSLRLDTAGGRTVVWLSVGRCLVGTWYPPKERFPFVALLQNAATDDFSAQHRRLGRIALIYETERPGNAKAPSAGDTADAVLAKTILDRLTAAIAVVDVTARLVHANSAGLAWFAAQDDLVNANGRVVVRETTLRPQFEAALTAAANEPQGRSTVLPLACVGDDDAARFVVVSPLGAGTRLAMLALGPQPNQPRCQDVVMAALGMTQAERRLAQQLLAGKRVDEAAKHANITVSTARTYVKRLFAKTGTRRQSEFVARVGALTPPFAVDTASTALPSVADVDG